MWIWLLTACEPAAPPTERACNGSVAACDLPFDEAAFAVAHNAMSTEADGFLGPNQTYGLTRQLEDGVRGLMLDLHDDDGVASLCHGYCSLGSRPLADGLAEVRAFLDAHPDDVVLLVNERYTDPLATADVFEAAGLADRAYPHVVGEPWPTLGELAEAGQQLVVFDQDPVADPAWMLHLYTEGWDTDYAATTADDFSCDVLRGDVENPLFLMNHFLTDPIALPELAELVNHQPLIGDRVAACEAETGDLVNLLAVDFYDIGDVIAVTDALNAAR